jgi:alkanesulfonate monooxygenase SsuD/methylene tetrahydromethanopterin reductase-like flavin-dependent oxidoreductase (luciferase family)
MMSPVRYGVILPGGTGPEQLEQAKLADEHGWDGVFVWEAAYGVDAWTLLGAMAAATRTVRLGTLLTPLPWRRPWKVASEVATLDQLSEGRAILAVGLGAVDTELPSTGEVTDLRGRANLLDEGIALVQALLAGETSYEGRHYRYDGGRRNDLVAAARHPQQPVPIWVVGVWPRRRSMARVLRCQGVIPQYQIGGRDPGPQDVAALRRWLVRRGAGGHDVVAEGETPADDPAGAAQTVAAWEDAGCTWWLETRWGGEPGGAARVAETSSRIAAGPPRRG